MTRFGGSFDMFQSMDGSAIQAFRQAAHRHKYSSGQIVYTQQQRGTEMYRVVSGSIRLTTRRPDGREAVFGLFGPGDCFGVSSLIDQRPRPQTAECLMASELDVVSAAAFDDLLDRYRSFSRAVMILLAQQMRIVSQYFESQQLTDLTSRIAARIIELAALKSGPSGAAKLVAELPQSELAALVGASRQSVNKILQSLQRDGIIALSNRSVQVIDPVGLHMRAEAGLTAEAVPLEARSVSRRGTGGTELHLTRPSCRSAGDHQ